MSVFTQFVGGSARVWVSGTSYLIGDVVLSPADNYQQYVRVTNGAGATDPASDATNYRPHGGRAVKSVQRGIINLGTGDVSATVTISAVNVNRSSLNNLGQTVSDATSNLTETRLVFTSATQITAIRRASGFPNTTETGYEVIEWY